MFRDFYFRHKVMMSDHTPCNFPRGNGDLMQRVFQSVSVAVGENCHPKGRELALTGCVAQKNCARLIVSKKFLQVEIFAFVL